MHLRPSFLTSSSMIFAVVLLRLAEGWASASDLGREGLHIGRDGRVNCEDVAPPVSSLLRPWIGTSIVLSSHAWRVLIVVCTTVATITGSCHLRVLLSELLSDQLEIFPFLLVAGELRADVLVSTITLSLMLLHRFAARVFWSECLLLPTADSSSRVRGRSAELS